LHILRFKFCRFLGALQDFGKESNIEKDNVADPNTSDLQKQIDKQSETSETEFAEKWTEDFLKQTADQFEKNLQTLLQNGEFNKIYEK